MPPLQLCRCIWCHFIQPNRCWSETTGHIADLLPGVFTSNKSKNALFLGSEICPGELSGFPNHPPSYPSQLVHTLILERRSDKKSKTILPLYQCMVQIQRQDEIFLMATAASHLESRPVFKPQENIYHIYCMSQFFVKYGEKCCLTLPPFTNISEKIIYFVALCVSPRARKGPTGDCLMIVGSCIKYTAAGGERREHIQAGCWGVGELKPECSL